MIRTIFNSENVIGIMSNLLYIKGFVLLFSLYKLYNILNSIYVYVATIIIIYNNLYWANLILLELKNFFNI